MPWGGGRKAEKGGGEGKGEEGRFVGDSGTVVPMHCPCRSTRPPAVTGFAFSHFPTLILEKGGRAGLGTGRA